MNESVKDTWYYIIVQNPGTPDEQFVGYMDEETGLTFMPCFENKEIAQQCFLLMPKDAINNKYEIQAVIKEDLMSLAAKNRYDVFLLDDKARIIRQIS